MTILEFLRLRLAKDEQAARAVIDADAGCRGTWAAVPVMEKEGRPALVDGSWVLTVMDPVPEAWPAATHAARHDPKRVLAEVTAKRKIIELAAEASGLDMSVDTDRRVGSRDAAGEPYIGDRILRQLAAAYQDHPHYDPAWRPT